MELRFNRCSEQWEPLAPYQTRVLNAIAAEKIAPEYYNIIRGCLFDWEVEEVISRWELVCAEGVEQTICYCFNCFSDEPICKYFVKLYQSWPNHKLEPVWVYHWSEQIKHAYNIPELKQTLNSLDSIKKNIKVVFVQQVRGYRELSAKMEKVKLKQRIAKLRAQKKRARR